MEPGQHTEGRQPGTGTQPSDGARASGKRGRALNRYAEQYDALQAGGSTREVMREDYALHRLPDAWRWGSSSVLMVLVGIITAFFFPTTGGEYFLAYGSASTLIGMVIAFVIMTLLITVTASAASREGLTSDLLTRGCGYGYMGSALTSLIYAFTYVIYAGLEGQILASAVESVWPIPIGIYYVIVGVLFIPLTWYGMRQLTWTMWLTIPLYLALLLLAIVNALNRAGGFPAHFFNAQPPGAILGGLGILGVMAGLSGTIGLNPMEYSDYNRFLKAGQFRKSFVPAVLLPNFLMFFVAFPLGIFFALIMKETNPGVYFVTLLGSGLGVLFAWITQVRINVTNVYSGSLAFSNFFVRVFKLAPGRIYWVALTSLLSVVLMFGNILGHLLMFLEWDGIYLVGWVATVVADLLVVKRLLHIGPSTIEYQKEKLRLINPVGVVALVVAVALGSGLYYGVSNPYVKDLAPYITFCVAFVLHVAIAVGTRGRYYYPSTANAGTAAVPKTQQSG
jgi:purine-cytosine permease-like protein